jgi:hypothetical protein
MVLVTKSRPKSTKIVENLASSLRLTKQSSISKKGAKEINLNFSHSFVEFKNVLQGQYKTAWKQVADRPRDGTHQARSIKQGKLCHAKELIIIKALHKTTSQGIAST